MTFENLVNMIRDTAKTVNPNGTFIYGRNSDVAAAFGKPMPMIVLYDFEQSDDEDEITSDTELTIGFYELDPGEQSRKVHEEQAIRMDNLIHLFKSQWKTDYENRFQYNSKPKRGKLDAGIIHGIIGFALIVSITTSFDEC